MQGSIIAARVIGSWCLCMYTYDSGPKTCILNRTFSDRLTFAVGLLVEFID